jgi:hypothetical protein
LRVTWSAFAILFDFIILTIYEKYEEVSANCFVYARYFVFFMPKVLQKRGSQQMIAESKIQLQEHNDSREFINSRSLNEGKGTYLS